MPSALRGNSIFGMTIDEDITNLGKAISALDKGWIMQAALDPAMVAEIAQRYGTTTEASEATIRYLKGLPAAPESVRHDG